jgi:hypothetical protein
MERRIGLPAAMLLIVSSGAGIVKIKPQCFSKGHKQFLVFKTFLSDLELKFHLF